MIHLNAAESAAERRGRGAANLYVESGVRAYDEAIVARGAVIVGAAPQAEAYGLTEVMCADPDGNWLSIAEETRDGAGDAR